jgi:hypothetical protein
MNLSKHITNIDLNSAKDRFTVSANEKQVDEAEAVVVTIPVPQVLSGLKGSIGQFIGTYKILLKKYFLYFFIVFF